MKRSVSAPRRAAFGSLFALSLSISIAAAATYQWNAGGSTNDWNDSDNWTVIGGTPNTVPDDTSDIANFVELTSANDVALPLPAEAIDEINISGDTDFEGDLTTWKVTVNKFTITGTKTADTTVTMNGGQIITSNF